MVKEVENEEKSVLPVEGSGFGAAIEKVENLLIGQGGRSRVNSGGGIRVKPSVSPLHYRYG